MSASSPVRPAVASRRPTCAPPIAAAANAEQQNWLNPAGTQLLDEALPGQFGFLVQYFLAVIGAMRPSTLRHAQAQATGGAINYGTFLTAATPASINGAAAAIRGQLLAGAPNAGAPADLNDRIEDKLREARESRSARAWSSAFVSHCVRRAAIDLGLETDAGGTHQGGDVLLRSSSGHRFYLHAAHQRTGQVDGTYHAFEPGAGGPVGDIIVQDRQARSLANVWQFANIPAILPGRELHGDIVVEVDRNARYVVTLGGNLGPTWRRCDGGRTRSTPTASSSCRTRSSTPKSPSAVSSCSRRACTLGQGFPVGARHASSPYSVRWRCASLSRARCLADRPLESAARFGQLTAAPAGRPWHDLRRSKKFLSTHWFSYVCAIAFRYGDEPAGSAQRSDRRAAHVRS